MEREPRAANWQALNEEADGVGCWLSSLSTLQQLRDTGRQLCQPEKESSQYVLLHTVTQLDVIKRPCTYYAGKSCKAFTGHSSPGDKSPMGTPSLTNSPTEVVAICTYVRTRVSRYHRVKLGECRMALHNATRTYRSQCLKFSPSLTEAVGNSVFLFERAAEFVTNKHAAGDQHAAPCRRGRFIIGSHTGFGPGCFLVQR